MKEPPSQTFAFLLQDLYEIPGEFIACLEWQRIPSDRMRRDVQSRRRHFFNKRVSIVNYVSPETRPEEMLVDDSANTTVRQLGDALTELEVNGHFFGSCSLTLVLHGHDARALQHQTAEAMKAMAVHDGSLFEETYNLLNAWLSIVPGNGAHNLRRLALLETNLADLSFLFTLDHGERDQSAPGPGSARRLRDAAPDALRLQPARPGRRAHARARRHRQRQELPAELPDHARAEVRAADRRPRSRSQLPEAGDAAGRALSGGGPPAARRHDQPVRARADARAPALPARVRPRAARRRRRRTGVSDLEDREIYEAVENLYVLDRSQRRLFTLANLLPRALAGRLHKWIGDGRYASLFDNLEDTLTVERLQVFDFEAMRAYPVLLEPLLFYVLHRVVARIQDPAEASSLKLCVMDEAWRFIQHPTLRAYVQEGLKTWRKRNAAMILATQTVEDFASADLLRTIVESCPTKLLLANPALDRRHYAELFQLNEMELDLLTGLIPRQQILLKRPDLAKVLTLTVDPKSYWIYTNTPIDNARVAETFREYGFEAGLDRLVASA